MSTKKNKNLTSVYYVSGMHCASCEILIEKKLRKISGVTTVDAVLSSNKLIIEHKKDNTISVEKLNQLFSEDGYLFSKSPFENSSSTSVSCQVDKSSTNSPYQALFLGLVFILGYILLSRTGFASLISVNSQSSLPLFFAFGLLAGFSSCAALVGGIVLSLSKQWLSLYNSRSTFIEKSQPHFLFNAGRVGGYAAFGAILGLVGNFFKLSPVFTAGLVIAISIVMILLGLQMVGVNALKNFQIRLPKSLTGRFADESNFQGKYAPLIMGALTFFLPCGFTITAQALALASGNPLQGALIMGLFALGTVPGLLAIGLSSVKFSSNPDTSRQFSLIAGMIVLFFAAFNINSQLAVLGVSNFNDLIPSSATRTSASSELPPMVNGVQVVRIDAMGFEYAPSRIKMRANTPTRWEVNAISVSGCTNAIISRGLFDGQIDLVNGQVAVKEFTSPASGVYKYSCWMGMVTGTVEVVDSSGTVGSAVNAAPVESGAKGCGCGGGGGTTCGGIR